MRKLTYVELSPDVKGYKPKVGDASVGAPLDSELFQERMKRLTPRKEGKRIQRGGKTLKALAWKSALSPRCGLTRFLVHPGVPGDSLSAQSGQGTCLKSQSP